MIVEPQRNVVMKQGEAQYFQSFKASYDGFSNVFVLQHSVIKTKHWRSLVQAVEQGFE